jgi:hypothetical protein
MTIYARIFGIIGQQSVATDPISDATPCFQTEQ